MIILGLLMILPFAVDLYYDLQGFKEAKYISFIIPIILLLILGSLLTLLKPKQIRIFAKEGLVICGAGWLIVSLFGAMPFVISGAIPSPINAFFESASGFTTTGSSILTDIQSLPKSILFWRSFTHWIGGMGILSFMIAIVPKSKGNSMYIMKAEMPGPKAGKVTARISQSARILYIIYSFITVSEILLLFAGTRITGDNVRFFDCVTTAFSNAGTGGFSVLNTSILGYHSSYVEWVIIVFMFLYGVNFNLYFFFVTRNFAAVYRDEELRAYIGLNLVAVGLIFGNIVHLYNNVGTAIRDSFFVVNSCMSSTGFATADFNTWPTFSKTLIVMLMLVGSMAGSTGGGMKVSRLVLYLKQALRDLRLMTRPNSVINVRMNRRIVDQQILKGVNAYLLLYVLIIIISILIVAFNGFDTTTTFTSVITCVNNIGPGLSVIGPTGNFFKFSALSKLVLIFDMLAGRLELFPILVLISPNTWRKTK
jgi:trk system potassium uptake protein TrkH